MSWKQDQPSPNGVWHFVRMIRNSPDWAIAARFTVFECPDQPPEKRFRGHFDIDTEMFRVTAPTLRQAQDKLIARAQAMHLELQRFLMQSEDQVDDIKEPT
jgi:hypothetical protein